MGKYKERAKKMSLERSQNRPFRDAISFFSALTRQLRDVRISGLPKKGKGAVKRML